jgi:hypothetical protein
MTYKAYVAALRKNLDQTVIDLGVIREVATAIEEEFDKYETELMVLEEAVASGNFKLIQAKANECIAFLEKIRLDLTKKFLKVIKIDKGSILLAKKSEKDLFPNVSGNERAEVITIYRELKSEYGDLDKAIRLIGAIIASTDLELKDLAKIAQAGKAGKEEEAREIFNRPVKQRKNTTNRKQLTTAINFLRYVVELEKEGRKEFEIIKKGRLPRITLIEEKIIATEKKLLKAEDKIAA